MSCLIFACDFRYTHRLVPVSGSCAVNVPEIQSLCCRIFKSFFDVQDPSQRFRVSLSHFTRTFGFVLNCFASTKLMHVFEILQHWASQPWYRQLQAAFQRDIRWILMTPSYLYWSRYSRCVQFVAAWHIFSVIQQNVCGISLVQDYYRLQKFNVMEIANERSSEGQFREGEGRVRDKD